MLGFATNRNYPNSDFFRIVCDVGNEVVLGCDAHAPGRVADPSEIERCMAFLKACGIQEVSNRMKLVPPTR